MAKRIERSTDPVSAKAAELHAYFSKWERALPNEIQQLASLDLDKNMNELITVAKAAEMIRAGSVLSLAGPESALDQLPAGNWIGGTIPYFMVDAGGTVVTEGQVFATDLTDLGAR